MPQLTFDLAKINEAAQWLIGQCQHHSVWLFDAPMGAGKTTLIRAICQELGVENTVQSPTFSIVNEYVTNKNKTIYHFDCYRLKNEMEAFDIGIEEYLDSGNYCFIEWPEKIASLLPEDCAKIEISVLENQKRVISAT